MTRTVERPSANLADIFRRGRPVIPFITAGFPDRRVFVESVKAAVAAGAGAIEIGMPFSDPLADGPAIQLSSQLALERGIDLPDVLKLTEQLRSQIDVPILLMGYLNPLVQMGFARFARQAADAGVAGTIIPDCPVGEAGEWRSVSREHGLANIFLIAPTTPDDRVTVIDRSSSVFSYCVSVAGVTGARGEVAGSTKQFLKRVAAIARKPYVVGFGISQPRHVRELKNYANGFVIGSALVHILRKASSRSAPSQVHRFIKSLVNAAQ